MALDALDRFTSGSDGGSLMHLLGIVTLAVSAFSLHLGRSTIGRSIAATLRFFLRILCAWSFKEFGYDKGNPPGNQIPETFLDIFGHLIWFCYSRFQICVWYAWKFGLSFCYVSDTYGFVILIWFFYILLWFSIRFRESWGSYLSENRIHIVSKQYQNHIKTTYFSSKPKHEKMIVPCILLWFNMISIRLRRGSAHPRLAKRQENRSSKTVNILKPSSYGLPMPYELGPSHGISWHFISFSWPYTKLWLWDTLSLSTGHPGPSGLWPSLGVSCVAGRLWRRPQRSFWWSPCWVAWRFGAAPARPARRRSTSCTARAASSSRRKRRKQRPIAAIAAEMKQLYNVVIRCNTL